MRISKFIKIIGHGLIEWIVERLPFIIHRESGGIINYLAVENDSERRRSAELEQKFGQILQSSFNEIYLLDATSLTFLQISEGAKQNLGISGNDLSELNSLDLRPGFTRENFEARVTPLREGKVQTLIFQTVHQRKNKSTYPVEVRLQLIESSPPVFLAIVQDISEREITEQIQKKLSRALKLLSGCSALLIRANNEQLLLEDTCRLAVEVGGYMMAWVGFAENNTNKIIRPIAKSNQEDEYLNAIKVTWNESELGLGPTGTAIRTRSSVVNMNTHTNPNMLPWREAAIKCGYQSSIALPLLYNNKILGVFTIYSAESQAFGNEEVLLLEELASNLAFGIEALRTRSARELAEQEARELSKHIQTVREEEKASFAREIHDDLGGTLIALKMEAYWLMNKLATKVELRPLHDCAKSMVDQLDTTIAIVRRLITEMRPSILDDLGLMEALKWKTTEFHNRTGIECRFFCTENGDGCMTHGICDGCKDVLDATQSVNLFRIAQEALTNIARHSNASKSEVGLYFGSNEIILSITDNGCGLPKEEIIPLTSFGLRGMRERVELLNGKIKFETPSGGALRESDIAEI